MRRTYRTFALFVALSGPAVAAGSGADGVSVDGRRATLAGQVLELAEDGGSCRLRRMGDEAATVLQIPAPCVFHRDRSARLRVLRRGPASYLLIESSRPRADAAPDCDTQLQAVRIVGHRIEVSPFRERVAACPPFQWDPPMFTELFRD